jgi:hypothetical protein
MASKITGAQLEYDANAPLIDVDTALEDLAEDLQRAGRIRQLHALRHVCAVAAGALAREESVKQAEVKAATGKLRQRTQER